MLYVSYEKHTFKEYTPISAIKFINIFKTIKEPPLSACLLPIKLLNSRNNAKHNIIVNNF